MKNTNLLYSALIATVLALNPLVTTSLNASTQQKTNSLSFRVAKNLNNRGLDEDMAREIADGFFSNDEELFSIMLKNIESGCSVLSEDEILNHISSMALHRKTLKLDSYDSLVNMTFKIKNRALEKETLKELENIAMKNFYFFTT